MSALVLIHEGVHGGVHEGVHGGAHGEIHGEAHDGPDGGVRGGVLDEVSGRAVETRGGGVPRRAGIPRSAAEGHLTLTRRGRSVLLALAAVLGLVLGFVGGRADAAPVPVATETVGVVVERGDTLWSFADRVAEPGEDLRDVVREIQDLNGMRSAGLVAGEVIQLPSR